MKKTDIRLQILFFLLSGLAIFSSAMGGYLYYSVLNEHAKDNAHKKAEQFLKDLGNSIDSYLAWSLLSVKSLAGLPELKQSLLNKNAGALSQANAILDHFKESLEVNVCYLMDTAGIVKASSNREAPDSFVGIPYKFRPYFSQALEGQPTLYMALGITSEKRGIYFSHAVYDQTRPLGTAVMKTSIEPMEKHIMKTRQGIVMLTDPHGVVFLSNRSDLLYNVLWEISPEAVLDIARTNQFGSEALIWTGMKLIDPSNALDRAGNRYRVHQQPLVHYPGWNLVYLHSQKEVLKNIIAPLRKSIGVGVILSCFFYGVLVFFLLKKANTSIIQQKKAEEALLIEKTKLQEALSNLKELSGLLPICSSCNKIRDDKGYWNQIETYIQEHSEATFSHGICPDCSDRLYGDQKWYIDMKKEKKRNL